MSETENHFTLGDLVGQRHPVRLGWWQIIRNSSVRQQAVSPPTGRKDPRTARVGGYRRQPIPQVGEPDLSSTDLDKRRFACGYDLSASETYVVKAQKLPKNPHAGKAVLVDITPGTNGGDTVKVYEGEAITHKLAANQLRDPISFDLDDPRYKVREDPDGVKRIASFVKNVMKVNAFDAEALKNAEVIEPFLKYFQELNELHGNAEVV